VSVALAHLLASLIAGSTPAAARLISLLENDGPGAADVRRAIAPFTGRGYVVGVTGPPGSGKSTLVNEMVTHLRSQGQRVGVVAVDPTSPFTGGALLGDRVRMQDHSTDPEVFVRSMATRGSLGGLAPATDDAVAVLDAWGARLILIETVGTGQAEVDVVAAADTVVVVTTPGMGDGVQTIKAGVMEIGDVFVVNKADRPEADRTVTDLRTALGLVPQGQWRPPVITTVAITGEGAVELLAAVADHRRSQEASGDLAARRRTRVRRHILRAAEARLRQHVIGASAAADLDALVERVAGGTLDPHSAAELLVAPAPRHALPAAPRESRGLQVPTPAEPPAAGEQPAVPARRAEGARLDHIGVAVRDLDAAGRFYREVLGLEVGEPELLLEDQVAAAFVVLGEARIELLEPATVDGPVARFIERRGEGLHHIAVVVPDITRALDAAREAGFALIDHDPRDGAHGTRIAFIHPKSSHGVLIELVDLGPG
jgi:LAO/AO transport system kinase